MSLDANSSGDSTVSQLPGDPPPTRRQFSQPRVGEMIAGVLRNRIVNGELEDGRVLPKQEDLLNEFGVSLPSLREAMRILETEGLISVRRGNVGGAVVHRPSSEAAAYILGLVLQSQRVVPSDLAAALRVLEPACAAMCASSTSRRRVAARLRNLISESESCLDDGPEFTRKSREFHDELARLCGNTTLRELLGTLETLWSHFEARWADDTARQGIYPDVKLRRRDVSDHEAIAHAIANGDELVAERASRRHLEQVHRWLLAHAGNQPLAITEFRVGLSSSQLRRPIAL
jgi:DNA-binding FadR family transcriptional regulator